MYLSYLTKGTSFSLLLYVCLICQYSITDILWFNMFRDPTKRFILTEYVPKLSQLRTRMVKHGGNKASVLRQIKKIPMIP